VISPRDPGERPADAADAQFERVVEVAQGDHAAAHGRPVRGESLERIRATDADPIEKLRALIADHVAASPRI